MNNKHLSIGWNLFPYPLEIWKCLCLEFLWCCLEGCWKMLHHSKWYRPSNKNKAVGPVTCNLQSIHSNQISHSFSWNISSVLVLVTERIFRLFLWILSINNIIYKSYIVEYRKKLAPSKWIWTHCTQRSLKKKKGKKEVTWYYKRYVLELRVAFAVAI